ncbi:MULTISPECIES: hypothetical protein [Paenibacillus]|uniref:hypothetical protein n=1 Tax=Paenibacillus TaxID=44249 RepID=UPI0022B92613|nr:hypothetical protein [Paenibacillus caseinilyticus]MCZ8521231.1 hypothetical protein [Paenibacillus caseinilyticus]
MLKGMKKLTLLTLSATALLNMGLFNNETAQAAAYSCDGTPGVYIYADANYGGSCVRLSDVGDYDLPSSMNIGNDSASSVKIVNGNGKYYEATLYKDSYFVGSSSRLLSSTSGLGNTPVGNDSVSSAKIRTVSSDVSQPTANNSLSYGEELRYAMKYLTSQNGRFKLIFQYDGNLVLYKDGGVPVWSTNTTGVYGFNSHANRAQFTGKLNVYANTAILAWSSNNSVIGQNLVVQDDGNVVIRNAAAGGGSTIVWSTNTAGQ